MQFKLRNSSDKTVSVKGLYVFSIEIPFFVDTYCYGRDKKTLLIRMAVSDLKMIGGYGDYERLIEI